MIVTCIVVAATAAGVSKRFSGFSHVGGIVGTSVSAVFLLTLGLMNAYILWKLYVQLKKVIALQPEEATSEGLKFEGGGCLFRSLKRLFRLIDRPWKMYPLGVMFGLGFDTSSEVALLGISGVEGSKGTGIWLIMLFPLLFTVGMCLIDTMDGALMMSLYVAPMKLGGLENNEAGRAEDEDVDLRETFDAEHLLRLDPKESIQPHVEYPPDIDIEQAKPQIDSKAVSRDPPLSPPIKAKDDPIDTGSSSVHLRAAVADPLPFLYYSFILTTLTVICAMVIGMIQLLTLILNVKNPSGNFWNGVAKAGDSYDIIGGGICGMFVVVGGASVAFYGKWRGWVDAKRERMVNAVQMERQEPINDTPVDTKSGKAVAVVEDVRGFQDREAQRSLAGTQSGSAGHGRDRIRLQ